MQIFSFCMAASKTIFYDVFSNNYGAPEEIRTPDPQIRSLVLYSVEPRRFPQSASHQSRGGTIKPQGPVVVPLIL
jgi:hypothetical protein